MEYMLNSDDDDDDDDDDDAENVPQNMVKHLNSLVSQGKITEEG